MSRPSIIPAGSWPRRMSAAVAAGYCGEESVEAFMKRVGTEYPQPRVNDGRRKLWLRDDLDQAILPPELTRRPRSRRGFVTVTLTLPRYVIAKRLASGKTAYYFNVPTRYRALGCTIRNEPLGTDYSVACGADGNGGRAAALNALFDEWLKDEER